jgi:ketosteroid isomerase-like protein
VPWFPDFVGAVELARVQTRAAGQADPVAGYLVALDRGDTSALETVWPGEVVVYDPRAGEVRGHRQLRRFVRHNAVWRAEHHVSTEIVASTRVEGRAVVELLAHFALDAVKLAWPVAVVAESHDDSAVVFRTYCSRFPVDRRRHLRPPILGPGSAHPGDVVARYQLALEAGDAEAIVELFAPDGYLREPIGSPYTHRGAAELRAFFTMCFSAGGGVSQEHCAVTDDGVRCALEYNCVRWGSREVAPQAGLAVYERGANGLLVAARLYDDIETPVVRPGLPGQDALPG